MAHENEKNLHQQNSGVGSEDAGRREPPEDLNRPEDAGQVVRRELFSLSALLGGLSAAACSSKTRSSYQGTYSSAANKSSENAEGEGDDVVLDDDTGEGGSSGTGKGGSGTGGDGSDYEDGEESRVQGMDEGSGLSDDDSEAAGEETCMVIMNQYALQQPDLNAMTETAVKQNGVGAGEFKVAVYGTHGGATNAKSSALIAVMPMDAGYLAAGDMLYLIVDDTDNKIAPVLAMHRVTGLNVSRAHIFDNIFINDKNQDKLRVVLRRAADGKLMAKKWKIGAKAADFMSKPADMTGPVISSHNLYLPATAQATKNAYRQMMPAFNGLGPTVPADKQTLIQKDGTPLKFAYSSDTQWSSFTITLDLESSMTQGRSNAGAEDNTQDEIAGGGDPGTAVRFQVTDLTGTSLCTVDKGEKSFDLVSETGDANILAKHNAFVVYVQSTTVDASTIYRYFYFLG